MFKQNKVVINAMAKNEDGWNFIQKILKSHPDKRIDLSKLKPGQTIPDLLYEQLGEDSLYVMFDLAEELKNSKSLDKSRGRWHSSQP